MTGRHARKPKQLISAATLRAILQQTLLDTAGYLDHPKKLIKSRGRLHQFRVRTRLASAAVILAEPVISSKRAREISRRLRKLRRTAGTVRDLDVAGDIVLKSIAHAAGTRRHVAEKIKKNRAKARRAAVSKLDRKQHRAVEKLAVKVLQPDEDETSILSTEAGVRRAVGKCLRRLARAARADLSNHESIHRVRRRLRTLRLVIQLSRTICPASALARAEPKLQTRQRQLGDLNDLFRAQQLLYATRRSLKRKVANDPTLKAASKQLQREHARTATRALEDFRRSSRWPELSRWCGSA